GRGGGGGGGAKGGGGPGPPLAQKRMTEKSLLRARLGAAFSAANSPARFGSAPLTSAPRLRPPTVSHWRRSMGPGQGVVGREAGMAGCPWRRGGDRADDTRRRRRPHLFSGRIAPTASEARGGRPG